MPISQGTYSPPNNFVQQYDQGQKKIRADLMDENFNDAAAAITTLLADFATVNKAASAGSLGMVKIGNGLKITADGLLYLDPWDIYPLRSPLPVQGITLSGRNPIMPGETEPRTNWLLCDGGTDGLGGNVPDLRGRFLLGSDASHADGSTGGSENHSHSLSGSVGATTLSAGQLGNHWHYEFSSSSTPQTSPRPNGTGANGMWQKPEANAPFNYNINRDQFISVYGWWEYDGTLNYAIMPAGTGYQAQMGRSFSPNNTSSSESHTHGLSGTTGAGALPPYYALAYLIRIK